MDFSRTTFVLGAGSSCPYGYPSGERLTHFIKNLVFDYKFRDDLFTDTSLSEESMHGINPKFKDFRNILINYMAKSFERMGVEKPGSIEMYDSLLYKSHLNTQLDKFISSFANSRVGSIDSYLFKFKAEKNIDEAAEGYHENTELMKVGKFLIAFIIRYYERWIPKFQNSYQPPLLLKVGS